MVEKDLVCIVCPRGCRLHVRVDDTENVSVSGYSCPRGLAYGKNEVVSPTRMVTSTVMTDSEEFPRCPVKTSVPVPKALIFDVMQEINSVRGKVPLHVGDILVRSVCGTEADIVATKNIEQ